MIPYLARLLKRSFAPSILGQRSPMPTRALRCEPLENRKMLSITLFVDGDAAPGGNGMAWGTAYNDLQNALT